MKIDELRDILFKEQSFDFEMLFNFTPEKAYNYFKSKGLVLTDSYKDYINMVYEKVFTVAGLTKESILKDVFDLVEKSIKDGESFDKFKDGIRDKLIKKGYLGDKLQIIDEVILTTPYRLQLIFRQNIQTSYMSGRMKFQSQDLSRPYWSYKGIMDDNTRPSHLALQRFFSDKVLHYSNPFWQSHYPPNGFLCRCFVRAFNLKDVQDNGYEIIREVPQELWFAEKPFDLSPIQL